MVRETDKKKLMFTRSIVLCSQEFSAFLDTGSQCNLIKQSVAETLPCKQIPCSVTINGFCGGMTQLTEYIEADIVIDSIKLKLKFYVVPDKFLDEDVLIGQGAFAGKNVQCIAVNGKFELKADISREAINENDLNVGELNVNEKENLVNLLGEYRDIFAINLKEIGETKLVQLKIELDTNIPIAQTPYRIPIPKKQIVNDMVQELLDNDIIFRSDSKYASPITLVKKKDGRKFTAFVTTEGIYEFKRMPFGLKNAPIVFQRLMAKIKDNSSSCVRS